MNDRPPLTLKQAAVLLDVHYMTAYRYVRSGRLRARKEGHEWLIDTRDLIAFQRADRSPRSPHASDLEEQLLQADEARSWSVVSHAVVGGMSPARVLTDLVGPALEDIGERWANGAVTPGQEHRATATAIRILGRLRPQLARRQPAAGRVVIGAPPGDQHELPLTIAADLLGNQGVEVSNVGSPVDAQTWARAVHAEEQSQRIGAVGICATTVGRDDALRAAVRAVRAATQIPIVVGGHGVSSAEQAGRVGADHYSDSVVAAVTLLRRLAMQA